ncbi:FAD/NAD(P)-binding protein [Vannielia sp.]|uniref:FAD/NAD(P)-binding protein n=1 Tax=Vannielia sp. TaxID=2813045 RepID=UPI00262DC98E|nr:FAD/NAD(P)-binding protein [Vannielia sp.]MDF1872394.1 FAD/NAD(P)-binding protein [Vannielia sp.]
MTHRIAFIGMGPRGLGAAEALLALWPEAMIEVFDPGMHPGAGPNFSPDQSPHCLLNLPLRNLDIARDGTLIDDITGDPERFPARAELGQHLCQRFNALGLTHHHRAVRDIQHDEASGGWMLSTPQGPEGPFAEVLIAPGQPRSHPDPQFSKWKAHAQEHALDLVPAYPDRALLAVAKGWAGKAVGVRGLALSSIDVVRLLTLGMGGRFKAGRYLPSGMEPARIVPFSLNGLPPAPKPATATLDAGFDATEAETARFEAALAEALDSPAEPPLAMICAALEVPVERITGDRAATRDWLAAERENPGSQEDRAAPEVLRGLIAMADGSASASPGYVAGQVWRKWQDALRKGFNPRDVAPEIAQAVTGFDDGMKRFSYGPPLTSATELMTLIEDGRVDMRAVDDPDIVTGPDGWRLCNDEDRVEVAAMVDAVLPSPDLSIVSDPLIARLRDRGVLVPLAEGLAAKTEPDGQVQPGLSVLGRMAYGSVIAVDSLHDCFGAAAQRWAEGVCARQRAPSSTMRGG